MTTQFYGFGNGRFGHPEQDRAISLREGAILQSFPPDYQFIPPHGQTSFKAIGRLIGNAVPVTLGEVIGASLLTKLNRQRYEQEVEKGLHGKPQKSIPIRGHEHPPSLPGRQAGSGSLGR